MAMINLLIFFCTNVFKGTVTRIKTTMECTQNDDNN